jgi:hypothetical protein|tara:strand:- start:121 stop:498 length:378 start_codon:yes stop_codon:yes gene_type:complete
MEKSYKEEVKRLDNTSRAGQLARELNAERNRLKEELAEAQEQVDIFAPSTPTGGLDSYIKWVATVLAVIGVFLISASLTTAGQVAYACSAIAWVYVGHCWNDKAIMIGSAITGTAVMMNLVEKLI